MAFTYTKIDGQRVQTTVASAFFALAAEFKRVFGLSLHVRSGTRTRAEQAALYQAYLRGGTLAAPPGQSNHEEYGPTGPRALDVYDSGGDPGVTRAGTVRANWLKANAFRFGFNPAGYSFKMIEPWHIEYTGSLSAGAPASLDPNSKLTVDGQLGPQTIAKLQSVIGANVDGEMGPQTISKLQERLRVPVDGQLGPVTISELQRRVGANVDGDWGPNTTSKLQEHLNAGGTLQATINPDAPLVVDGELGVATISKLQKVLGAGVDGQWGPDTTSKLQAAVGTAVDGQLGPQTIKALQLNVGATVDGAMGPNTITKLQEFLNAGKTFQKVEIPADTQPPQPTEPASPDNPRGLKTYQPFFPGAFVGLEAPLGKFPRGTGYSDQRAVEVVIDQFHIHRTGTKGDDGSWFSYENSRGSCPHLHIMSDARVREFIRPKMKPCLTGPDWNWRGYGIEIQGDGDGTPQQFEKVAQAMAWLASYEGKLLDGVPVKYNLRNRTNTTLTHREMLPGTECPGNWWQNNIDALIDRARVILAAMQGDPGDIPETPEEPGEEPDTSKELNDAIKAKYAELGNLIKELE